ncbi:MAG: hypothetical protein KFF50_08690, partial [Desulfatitalea sp.]|nr:hypothetical protein [Desulfatitalea sp.]
IGILATISMQISSMQANSLARHNTEAAARAVSVVEALKPLRFNDDALAPGDHDLSRSDDPYSINYSVEQNAIVSGSKSIRVTVGWMDGSIQKRVNIDYLIPDTI